MSSSLNVPESADSVQKTAGAEPSFIALLNLTHGMMAIAGETKPTKLDLERLHDMAQQVVKISAALLTDSMQGRLLL